MANNIAWLDLEMTGLDPETDNILEIGCFITNDALEITSPIFHMIIHNSDDILKSMDKWCKKTHTKNGLITEVMNSKTSLEVAEKKLIQFFKAHASSDKAIILAGNSIYIDKGFLCEHMPRLYPMLHYRVIDVSSFAEIFKRVNPQKYAQRPKKRCIHRAVNDIKDSLAEMQYYKSFISLT
ncbi:putative oligoribonuclease [Diachasmimorpha longicaudata entomopoxvirus]|nr:putative oligoribonuclease [Diachasmimorpha longicaudata entomopoxvirus]AKS26367.1 putative oligoribonuclease [Diachasmimorpha longicaudata entomopoxvirus]